MAKFLYLFRGGASSLSPPLSPSELQAHLAKWTIWMRALRDAGHAPGGQALKRDGKTIRGRDLVVTDGPFAETREQLGGFYLIDVPSLDEATKWASKIPSALYGSIEVRPLTDNQANNQV